MIKVKLPILQKDDVRAFFASDEELDILEAEEKAIYKAWKDVIFDPDFKALSFAMEGSKIAVVSKSFLKTFNWRISCFEIKKGQLEAVYHGDYALTKESDTLAHELALISMDGNIAVQNA